MDPPFSLLSEGPLAVIEKPTTQKTNNSKMREKAKKV